ncbi:O-antigen/teichoic acid export membrane protein [Novosphingobium kunmingense]|uniref:O-antigen/teichoic acid export membrane protein n=1 Tax=Novosphingobium kunmingense TaxID=1211806 RepID=A0A2N0H657_9SPHN|nr:lipopolysaccharide biosynthesis protein [Novosphingobium kunmingense]PKB14431.1 O-antigen/teichoic acid export membrane protein [Novosphingobium kunmingense]
MSDDRAAPDQQQKDIQALAKGGRTNFFGFLLRLAARLPFLFIAGRLYGAESLGRFALALVVVELAAQLCTLGQKRGLAMRLSHDREHPANTVADAMLLGGSLALLASGIIYLLPDIMFSGAYTQAERLVVLAILPLTLTEIALAAQAYRFDIATSVRSRALVEPWTLSILSGILFFVDRESGMLIAYNLSVMAAAITALWPMFKTYGLPHQWKPKPLEIGQLALVNLPLAAADAVEWGTRRFDIYLLGFFAGDKAVGVYYVAQQIASVPQKLKTSFEPILGPVITRNLKEKNYEAIARQVCQVGFWITAAQAGVALALGMPGEGVMGLVGPMFVGGTAALCFLLAAEVSAATAVVSEAVLIYVKRMQNLWISLATLVVQAGATISLIKLVEQLGLNDNYKAAMAGAGLMVALGLASWVKSRMLARFLQQSVNNWRWPLIWAAAPAVVIGWAATSFLPEWAELSLGIPAILLAYGFVIWHKGFGAEDRVLFRRNVGA